jgi:hypothetical protein
VLERFKVSVTPPNLWTKVQRQTLAFLLSVVTGPTLASTAAETGLGQILAAGKLADACPVLVHRKGDRDQRAFINASVGQLASEGRVTVKDIAALTDGRSPESFDAVALQQLSLRGIDLDDPQRACFKARAIAGEADGLGRFLERR